MEIESDENFSNAETKSNPQGGGTRLSKLEK